MQELNLDQNPPNGGLFHVSALLPTGLRVVDLWESAEAFNKFNETRIAPAVRKVGITTQPTVEIHPVHNVYAPGIATIGTIGAGRVGNRIGPSLTGTVRFVCSVSRFFQSCQPE